MKYRLYAMKVTGDNLCLATREQFSRITADYILIYTQSEIATGVEITDAEASRLNDAEKNWLSECNWLIIGEETKVHADKMAENAMAKLQQFEALLEEEQRNMTDGTCEHQC